ncbi:MAG: tetratricopeptide repeat protein, partial [Bacteroidales bacterium]|nr:tetratricopeptide repeat protein [Bacteroidales bacterium]
MKKTTIIFVLLAFAFLGMQAQTQSGVVKTRGRMVGGKLVPGTMLSGATVQVEGRQALLATDGRFSFPVSGNSYTLKNVSKQGYQLVDAEVCRSYRYSGNPLSVVMETPEQQQQDKLTAERKIRRQLQNQLRDKEDEIEALREQNRLTDEQYNNALQQLYSQQESNERLISDMAQRYSVLDYDQLDDFQRQVSSCIENGQLAKADSLLRSRGDVGQQVEAALKAGAALKQKLDQQQKVEAVHSAEMNEVAQRCYSFYELFVARFQNDSAAYYLELRSRLDTTNIEWLLEAGEFYMDYVADYDKAMSLFETAMRQSKKQNGETTGTMSEVFNDMGVVYFALGDFAKAMEKYQKALEIGQKAFGKEHGKVASFLHNIGQVCYRQGEYQKALDYFDEALRIKEKIFGKESELLADVLNDQGVV